MRSKNDPLAPAEPASSPIELINQMHIALRATLKIEDLYSIILAVAISDQGLGFDRAFLFLFDEKTQTLHGHRAIGVRDSQRHQTIRNEILEETQWLQERSKGPAPAYADANEDMQWLQHLEGLKSHAFWIDTIQKYEEEAELESAIRQTQVPCPARQSAPAGAKNTLAKIAQSARAMDLSNGGPEDPAFLTECIGRPALGASLKTKKGLRGVLIADLNFTASGAVPENQRHLFEWYVAQASVALENSELYSDLEDAYKEMQAFESMKNNFLSTISHELRTPLTSIMGFAQILLGKGAGPVSDEQGEFIRRIERHSMRLCDMVDDLLEIAEAHAATDELTACMRIDPLEALMETLPKLEHRMKDKKVDVEPHVIGRVPAIMANAEALQRVLFHLLDNAIKFSPGGQTVVVNFHVRGKHLRIEIEDQGIGLSEDEMQRIFSGFYQVDSRLARNYEGLGIGLTLSRKLLEAMGGAIHVESLPGKGSRFSIDLPVAPEEENSHVP